jgi:hypothetical protein
MEYRIESQAIPEGNASSPQTTDNTHFPEKEETENKNTFISDPDILLSKYTRDKKVKVVDRRVPWKNDIVLFDLSLESKVANEDREYAFSEEYRVNIRRGNSIAVIQSNDDGVRKEKKVIARKGLMKFFDIQPQYIQYNLKEVKEFSGRFVKDASEHAAIRKIIFDGIEKTLEARNTCVSIFKMVKSNGVNAQISYLRSEDAWVIASKNVALLAKNLSDVESYGDKGDRYNYARLIAERWFRTGIGLLKDFKN